MREKRKKIIHYSRRYLTRLFKELRIIAVVGVGIILLLNITANKGPFVKAKESLLSNSGDFLARNYLTDQLLGGNQVQEAEKISGESEKIEKIKRQPEEIKKEILGWQKITDEFPNYRDGYIKLAILNWKIYRIFDAKKFLEIALGIDPNNETALKLNSWLK